MKKPIIIIAIAASVILFIIGTFYSEHSNHKNEPAKKNQSDESSTEQGLLSQGLVTMIDLGATECIPCKMMAPIIEELKKEYQGKASIFFIDVWKNPNEAKKYGIRAIPTQIFFDKSGKEFSRHTGFMDKKSIIAMLEKIEGK